MFVALQLKQQENGSIFSKLRGILLGTKTSVNTHTLLDTPYVLLRAETHRSLLDWDKIEQIASEYSHHILLPQGLDLPSDSMLHAFTPSTFNLEVLVHTACNIIHKTRMPMYRRVLGLIDEDGAYLDMLPQLLKYFTSVKVLTCNHKQYHKASEEMMMQLGAPVLLADSLDRLNDCVLILSPALYRSDEAVRLSCPVLSIEPCSFHSSPEAFHSLTVSAPVYGESIPAGVCPHQLLAALYELQGNRDMELVASHFLYNNKYATLHEAVQIVANMAGFSHVYPF